LHLGIGLIEKNGPRVRLLFAETLHAPAKKSFYERLDYLYLRLTEELRPEEIAVEDTFFAKNAQSAFRLGMARGVAVAACLGRGLPIYEYAPTQVKSVVTGYGRADKEQVRKMVGLSLGTNLGLELGFDATDAIAVALCHASFLKLGALTP
jgi:crossover junction endodeoxyribonuclease RuvC